MTYREKGLIGFGILMVLIETLFLYPIPWLLRAVPFALFVWACWWLATAQQRYARKRAEREQELPKWLKDIFDTPGDSDADAIRKAQRERP